MSVENMLAITLDQRGIGRGPVLDGPSFQSLAADGLGGVF
jgi:hypothetical protein